MSRSPRMAAADEDTSSFSQAPPPSYLVLMEEGLPSYEEAVMVGQEMKQGMVSKWQRMRRSTATCRPLWRLTGWRGQRWLHRRMRLRTRSLRRLWKRRRRRGKR